MGTAKQGTTNGKGFQNFIFSERNSSVLVSEQLKKEIKNDYVHKYLSIDYFVDSIIHQYFYLASPSTWEDPFETKYLEFLDYFQTDKEELQKMSIFCTCMTYNDTDSEEASWKSYGNDKEEIIRVTYSFNKLLEIFVKTGENIYIGKMDYRPRKEIVNPTAVPCKRGTKENLLEVLYVNNFCLKQEAYQYEKELRFCKILRGEQFKAKKDYRIEPVNLNPAISRITLPPINYRKLKVDEVKGKLFEQIKKYLLLKSICPEVPIYMSNLYDSSKEEMSSEFTL